MLKEAVNAAAQAMCMLLSTRISLRRLHQVVYKAPGLLHGTYMLEKRGAVSVADLRHHALRMRYGTDMVMIGHEMMLGWHVEVIEVR